MHVLKSMILFDILLIRVSVIHASLKRLNIMGLLPISGEKWSGGGACLTAAQMALRHVNQRTDVLKDYYLDLHWRDGQVTFLVFSL